jgi:hypothetical protein
MWKNEVEKLREKTGQSSEIFFLNKDGTLNYQKMITTIDQMIADDILSPLKHLDPHNHRNRKGSHPAKNTLDEFRNREPQKVEKPSSTEISTPTPNKSSEEFIGVRLDVGDEFDELFDFKPPNNTKEFAGVSINVGEEFDELFGFS